MAFALSGPHRIYYELDGSPERPPLLLLRGLARSLEYWVDIREQLTDHFHVVLMDNRGVGRSAAPKRPFSTAQMADDAAAVLEAAEIGSAHVFGISLGGMVAQWLALRHPERVDRLVLGATSPGGRGAIKVHPKTALSLAASSRFSFAEQIRRTSPFALHPQFVRENPDIVDEWVEIASQVPARRRGVVNQFFAAGLHNAWRHLPKIKAPTLVVAGTRDVLIPFENGYRLAERIPNAQLTILDRAGHDFPTERPEETVELLSEFLLSRH